MLSDCAYI